jgi:hypothetical protein
VRAPVNLDEFAEARAPFANLENLLGPPSLGPPQPQPDPDLADRLFRHRDAVDLAKLLAGLRRAKIGAARPQAPLRSPRPSPNRPVVRRPSSPARAKLASPSPRQPRTRRFTCRTPMPKSSAARACRSSPRKIRRTTSSRSRSAPPTAKTSPLKPAPFCFPQKGTSQLCSRGTFQLGRSGRSIAMLSIATSCRKTECRLQSPS